MTENVRPASNSQAQCADQVPEMDLGAFRKLMRNAFAIASEPSEANPKLTRFIAPPYNPFVSKATSVEGHNGGTKISPRHILTLLKKFAIEPKDFLAALRDGEETAPPSPRPPELPGSQRPN